VGWAGRVAPAVLERFELDQPVAVAEIRLDTVDLSPRAMTFEPFARHPGVKRDLSLIVPDGVAYGDLHEAVAGAGGDLLESVELFDIYRGKGVAEGHAAYGIRLLFRSPKGNLKGKTVDRAIEGVLKALRDRWNIEARS